MKTLWWIASAYYLFLRPKRPQEKLDLLYGKPGHRNVEWRMQGGNFVCVNRSTGEPVNFDCKPWIGPAPGSEMLEGYTTR